MHKATLKRLIRENSLDGGYVEVNSGTEVEIHITDFDGLTDYERTDTIKDLFCENVADWGGYKTGYGAWILQEDYKSKGDWNDKTSAWHY